MARKVVWSHKATAVGFKKKIEELKEAVRDNLFLDDLRDISEDFRAVDLERWRQEDYENIYIY